MTVQGFMEIVRGIIRPMSIIAFICVFLWAIVRIVDWLLIQLADVVLDQNLVIPIIVGLVTTFSTSIVWLTGSWWGGRQNRKEKPE